MNKNEEKALYLRITIHDNDFIHSLTEVGRVLQNIFWSENKYIMPEDNLEELKVMIQHIWYGIHNANHIVRCGEHWSKFEYFKPTLEFVEYLNIPEDDNYESIYIPLFDASEEILVR